MYATCLFCNQPLGANQTIAAFPVGRRLAFDADRGRLWVVCRKCERWNLSPIDERWEAMEECERLYRDTRTRVATDQIGLARLAEGLELIRIGRPLRPEFAAWRYGDQFGRRRRRTILLGTGVAVVFGGIVVGGAVTGVLGGGILAQSGNFVNLFVNARTRVRVRTDDGRVLKLRTPDLQEARIMPGSETGGMAISLGKGKRREWFIGTEAERVAGIILPRLNSMGGTKATVREAVERIETDGGPQAFLQSAVRNAREASAKSAEQAGRIVKLPMATRLAIEMALHEEQERRALEGELYILEEAWRQAEEIAAISDDLIVAPGTRERLAELKARRD
jgi:hypothetical protein